MEYKNLTDNELVEKSLEEDEEAFKEIIRRYQKKVFSIAYKHSYNTETSYDLSQEIFAKVYLNLRKFNPEFRFSTWIIRLGTNHCIDHLRKKRLQTISYETTFRNEDDEFSNLPIPDESYNPETLWEENELQEKLQKAVEELPDIYREIIILRHYEEHSYKEISELLDLPLGTVMTYLHRARNMLKEYFFEDSKEEEDLNEEK
ncbi:MAG TPA: sigma-70 family RNA polymerase sigma factor [Firmicutes bacterium]|nr:sigma-70 family RNA polymerase sigma factor [Bacillota bacterium]